MINQDERCRGEDHRCIDSPWKQRWMNIECLSWLFSLLLHLLHSKGYLPSIKFKHVLPKDVVFRDVDASKGFASCLTFTSEVCYQISISEGLEQHQE